MNAHTRRLRNIAINRLSDIVSFGTDDTAATSFLPAFLP
jgi:hypothetical protein